MKHQIYSIYDSKAKGWWKPFYAVREGDVMRQWMDLANDKKHPIGQHPEDYSLFKIGEWDDDDCQLIMLKEKVSIGVAIQFLKTDIPLGGNGQAKLKVEDKRMEPENA